MVNKKNKSRHYFIVYRAAKTPLKQLLVLLIRHYFNGITFFYYNDDIEQSKLLIAGYRVFTD